MNDDDFIDELREGLRAHVDHTEVPAGFADGARRTARRRSARRAAMAGTPLVAAAGVATVLAAGAGSGGSAQHGAQPNVNVGGGQTHDIAYIVKRVKANVADHTQSGTVIHSTDYRTGEVSSDGSLVNLGWEMDDGYEYVDADGTEYDRQTTYYQDGSAELITIDQWVPGAGNRGAQTETEIGPTNHEYSQTQYAGVYNPDDNPAASATTPTLYSSPSQVQQALQSGQVTQAGTATVDGTPAIALSIEEPNAPGNPDTDIALYVDAQTYQPLREVSLTGGDGHVLVVSDWVPATSESIAMAKDDSIPTGYTKATSAQVDAGTYGKQ